MIEANASEDKAKKAMLDAAKLAEELRYEQDHAQALERDRKDLEMKAHDIQMQLDDAEQNAIKWGRKMVAKLESRAKELESELDSEQRRLGDATKNFRKADRGIKEYTFRADEDRKNAERMQDLVEKLQHQVSQYIIVYTYSKSNVKHITVIRFAITRSRLKRLKRLPPST